MDDIFPGKVGRRQQIDLNVVPILDMLVCVIFFLLLSTSFIGYTKLTLPPSGVSTLTEPLAPAPLNPKLLITQDKGQMKFLIKWEGASPGYKIKKAAYTDAFKENEQITSDIKILLKDFLDEYKDQKTLQIGMGPGVAYQYLISAMDAAQGLMPDQVIISYDEAKLVSEKVINEK